MPPRADSEVSANPPPLHLLAALTAAAPAAWLAIGLVTGGTLPGAPWRVGPTSPFGLGLAFAALHVGAAVALWLATSLRTRGPRVAISTCGLCLLALGIDPAAYAAVGLLLRGGGAWALIAVAAALPGMVALGLLFRRSRRELTLVPTLLIMHAALILGSQAHGGVASWKRLFG